MESIRLAYKMGVHVEVSTLIVGERNSDEKTLTEIGEFIRSVNPDITLHISRYFPCYRMNDPSTDIATMKKAYHTLKKMLRDVRPGNVTSEEFRRITEN